MTMDAPTNTFKTALRARKTQIGLWLGLADAYCAEICAEAGFDWLLIDGEHAPNDLRSILAQLQAAAAHASHPIVRPPIGEVYLIKQLLDIGAQTLLIPMVESAKQAEQLVAAVRYPPRGVRGVGSALARASQFNSLDRYLLTADEQICLLVQVESLAGLSNIDAIASTEGVDGVFIGPSDLAAAMGHIGNSSHPDVVAAIEKAIAAILAANKAAGILSADEALARRYLQLGATFVAVGTDVSLLGKGATNLANRFAQTNKEAAPSPKISP
jgi:4-hydroxy-2-oxoheptanedioate aldolase